jgi:hypothetical protein
MAAFLCVLFQHKLRMFVKDIHVSFKKKFLQIYPLARTGTPLIGILHHAPAAVTREGISIRGAAGGQPRDTAKGRHH